MGGNREAAKRSLLDAVDKGKNRSHTVNNDLLKQNAERNQKTFPLVLRSIKKTMTYQLANTIEEHRREDERFSSMFFASLLHLSNTKAYPDCLLTRNQISLSVGGFAVIVTFIR